MMYNCMPGFKTSNHNLDHISHRLDTPSHSPSPLQLIGISMAIGFWTVSVYYRFQMSTRLQCRTHLHFPPFISQLCYALQPGKLLARPLLQSRRRWHTLGKLQETYGMAMARTGASVQRLPKFLQRDPARLSVSLAESLCLRAALKWWY